MCTCILHIYHVKNILNHVFFDNSIVKKSSANVCLTMFEHI